MATTPANNTVASLQSQIAPLLNQLQAAGINPTGAAGGGATTGAATGATGAAAAGGDTKKPLKIPATGKPQMVQINGQTKYFDSGIDPTTGGRRPDGMAYEITAFQYTEGHEFKINLDYREGIATGLANLSRIFGARQERVRLLSNALANDANTTGSFSPVDLQKMSLETTTTEQLSQMQKKIFDSMKGSIDAWLR